MLVLLLVASVHIDVSLQLQQLHGVAMDYRFAFVALFGYPLVLDFQIPDLLL